MSHDPRFVRGTEGPLPGAVPLPPIRWPPWMDAGYMMLASHPEVQIFTTPGAAGSVLVPGDSRRWAIGFFPKIGFGAQFVVSPFDGKGQFGWPTAMTSEPRWFTLFEHGPIVGGQWFIQAAGAGDVLVASILLQ